jgi:hypothetical protein
MSSAGLAFAGPLRRVERPPDYLKSTLGPSLGDTLCCCASPAARLGLMLRDIVNCVLDGHDLFCLFVRDLHPELLFE